MERAIAAALGVFIATTAQAQDQVIPIPVPCWETEAGVMEWLGERAELIELDENRHGVAGVYAESLSILALLVRFPNGAYCSMWSSEVQSS